MLRAMRMTAEMVRAHAAKNALPCALDGVVRVSREAFAPVAPVEPTPAQERWQAGEEAELQKLIQTNCERLGCYVLRSRMDRKPTIREGHPDLSIFHGTRCCFLEVKAGNGKPTAKQRECIADLERAGCAAAVVWNFDEAMAFARKHLQL